MKSRKYEVKSIDEAMPLAVAEMGIAEEDLSVEVINEKKGFLGIGINLKLK